MTAQAKRADECIFRQRCGGMKHRPCTHKRFAEGSLSKAMNPCCQVADADLSQRSYRDFHLIFEAELWNISGTRVTTGNKLLFIVNGT